MEATFCPFCGREMERRGRIYPVAGASGAASHIQTVYNCPSCGLIAWDVEFGFKSNFPMDGLVED